MSGAPPQRPVVEWVVGIASALIVAALTAYLIHRAAFDDPTPALLEVALERVETTDQGQVIRIKLTNRGDTAAAAIAVSATPPDPALRKQITFDQIAPRSTRFGALIYAAPISADDVDIAIDGYTDP